jgi:hypothetical protein
MTKQEGVDPVQAAVQPTMSATGTAASFRVSLIPREFLPCGGRRLGARATRDGRDYR